MDLFVALPLALSAFAGSSWAAQPVAAPPSSVDRHACRSDFTTAGATKGGKAVYRPESDEPRALLLWAVDRRLDGCEMIVPAGDPLRPLPLPKMSDPARPGDLFHRAGR